MKKLRTLNTTVQVLEMIFMLNEVIQANQIFFMNFWYILTLRCKFCRCINRTYQMFAHRSCVIPFTKITMFPYPEQVQDIERYDASAGDHLDAKLTNSSNSNGFHEILDN